VIKLVSPYCHTTYVRHRIHTFMMEGIYVYLISDYFHVSVHGTLM